MQVMRSRVISIKINSANDEVEISKDAAEQSSLVSVAEEFTNDQDRMGQNESQHLSAVDLNNEQ